MKISFYFKQIVKMGVQHIYLPVIYFFGCVQKVDKKMILFSDTHHDSIPFSMGEMHRKVETLDGVKIYDMYLDIQKCSIPTLIKWLNRFMKAYASAGYVFICDNHLPVSSCKKRKGTTVVQLWHSGGLLKKAGYDTPDTIPKVYKGNVYKNYDLLTVSAPCCIKDIQSSMRQPEDVVKATGISRTDIYYDEKFNQNCRKEFDEKYTEAAGKKIVVWLPTFRGNAADPVLVGEEEIDQAFAELDSCFLVKKFHPHYESKYPEKINCDIPSHRLLPVADLLITDYSSVVFDYLIYKKPFVFFAPDYEDFEKKRGFYRPYNSYPTTVAKNAPELVNAVKYELLKRRVEDLEACLKDHMGMCDGKATERILEQIGLL